MSLLNTSMTKGVLNALNKNRNRTTCPECGFPLPVYPGRYPKKCPKCGREMDASAGQDGSSAA